MFERSLDDLVEALHGCKENGRRCSVLIGAGCSKSAGIPLAGEFVAEIKRAYPAAYRRAVDKSYPACMAALDMGVRRDLIGRYIDAAKINWAHIALAQLIHVEYVDRVLSTNFDPLVSRACALINVFLLFMILLPLTGSNQIRSVRKQSFTCTAKETASCCLIQTRRCNVTKGIFALFLRMHIRAGFGLS